MDGTPFIRRDSNERPLLHGVSEVFHIGGPFINLDSKENHESLKSEKIEADEEYAV
jgi:hypothetical protein